MSSAHCQNCTLAIAHGIKLCRDCLMSVQTLTGDALAAQNECGEILEYVDFQIERHKERGEGQAVWALEGLRRWLHVRIEER